MDIIEAGSVVALHLTNGITTVICRVDSEDEMGFSVYRPMELHVMPGPQGLKVGLEAWLSLYGVFPALETTEIPYESVLYARLATPQIEEAWRNATGSIAVPAKQSLIVP